jgi:large subunit ribosomal protein L6e
MAPTKAKAASKKAAAAGGVTKPARKSRNYELVPGVRRFSKSRMYHKKALWKKVKHGLREAKKPEKKERYVKKELGGKSGGFRMVRVKKAPQYYHPEGAPKPRDRRRKPSAARGTPKLRSSLTPGTVCILLAGRHKGKRVVFLKQLPSGLLLVTGPFQLNGCPLRRMQQSYVIATSTKVDLSKVQVPAHLTDDYFRRVRLGAAASSKKKDEDIFAATKEKYTVTEQRKKDQKEVDALVLGVIKENPEKVALRKYLGATFGLRHGMLPHEMKF